jgi:hypothetical protein
MWTAEHSIETSAPPEAVWRLWAEVAGWPNWNADLAQAELDGEFREGSTIRMTSNCVYRMEITGPEADTVGADLGPQISGDFPDVLAALAEHAAR